MTESYIQRAIATHLHATQQVVCVPNVFLFNYWESDLLVYDTDSGFTKEIEVKVSRSDFFADMKKHKFQNLRISKGRGPNYFAYAVPEGLVEKDEVPGFAGLYTVSEDASFGKYSTRGIKSVKRCTRLHDRETKARRISYATRGLSLRYWEQERAIARADD